jgi:TetR/AcrR family tetracycline transcriptional repressor
VRDATTLGVVQLNRDRILTAAVDILTEYGLGDLTMRRLARTLDVAPGALYWHYPSKQDLLGGIAGHILDAAVPTGPSGGVQTSGDWRERTYTTAARLLDQLLSVRDGAEVVAAALAAGTATQDPAGTLAGSLAGSPAPDPELTGWVLSRYLLGAATDVQTAQAAGVEPRTVSQVLSGVDLVLDGIGN